MSPVRFTPNRAGLNYVLRARGGPVDSYMRDLAELVAVLARREAPEGPDANAIGEPRKRTEPKLKDNIVVVPSAKPAGYEIRALNSYARAVHNGSKPHVIVPRRAKVLRFVPETGEIVFTGRVQHPGTPANPFLLRALRRALR